LPLRHHARGFTLVELLIVVAVMGLMAALVGPGLGSVTGANARQSAGELAGSMRALFDTAALRHATCRMVLDLGERAWWAECAPGRTGIARDPERTPDRPALTDAELEERFPEERDADVRRLLAGTKFGVYEDRLVKKRELPGRTAFGEVRVEGRRGAITEGLAYVYFFPGGQAQRAYVPVVDGDNVYTIVLEPFTGRARVVAGPVEVRE
jgi:general secretion pathway protein H